MKLQREKKETVGEPTKKKKTERKKKREKEKEKEPRLNVQKGEKKGGNQKIRR